MDLPSSKAVAAGIAADSRYFISVDKKWLVSSVLPECRSHQKPIQVNGCAWKMPHLSFSEDDCTRQRGLKAVVQSSIGVVSENGK
ncbi:hypothetical protein D7S60_29570 [Ralstonia insidiosa]|nr:hypothetical protein [Ralstonia insidiosa]MBA9955549.1 hypothetical protein [Ralstonia insidiosa]MBA9971980.1 hypothetical protein [Ralstonia insidiosa]